MEKIINKLLDKTELDPEHLLSRNHKGVNSWKRITVRSFLTDIITNNGLAVSLTTKKKYLNLIFPEIKTSKHWRNTLINYSGMFFCNSCNNWKDIGNTKSRTDHRDICYRCIRKENSK